MQANQELQDDNFMFHPGNVMLSILLFGLSALFLALTVAYVYTRVTMEVPPVKLPALFLFNTLILLGSSYTMIQAKKCYLADDTKGYQQNLRLTILLSGLFMLMQLLAWTLLFNNNIHLKKYKTTAYLYVISFVHLANVIGKLPFVFSF